MKNIALWIIQKWLTPEAIAELLAHGIAKLLRKASESKNWDIIKGLILRIEQACHLFNVCYDDDEMNEEDEERIAEAIEQLAAGIDVSELLSKVKGKK